MSARVVGPITGGAHGIAFGGTLADLGTLGFRQDEYLIEGTAESFTALGELSFDGRWLVGPSGSAEFRTRMLVTAPIDPARFNGTVIVEWNNVSAGFDIMLADEPALFELGFAHVGITTQYVGVHGHPDASMGLVAWDPERYGTLHHPGDRYSFDVYAQAAQLVARDRSLGALDPMRGLPVDKLVALGGSQSAGRLATFINAVAQHRPVFDSIVLVTYFGSGAALDTDTVLDVRQVDAGEQRLFPAGTLLRGDLGIPLLVVNSETEVLFHAPVRQSDTDQYRCWEVAGTAHATVPEMTNIFMKLMRDGIAMPTVAEMSEMPPMCAIAWKPVMNTALDHLQRWIHGGPPPPNQPLIDITGDGVDIVRDDRGIARGGVRLPDVDVPLAAHTGVNGLGGMMVLNGASVPYPRASIDAMYRDRDDYLARFDDAAGRAVSAGVLMPSAVAALRVVAEQNSHMVFA
jgi:Alpha/beta hydrolase domain